MDLGRAIETKLHNERRRTAGKLALEARKKLQDERDMGATRRFSGGWRNADQA